MKMEVLKADGCEHSASLAQRQDCEQTIRQYTEQFAAQGSQDTSAIFLIEQDARNEVWRVVRSRSEL